MANLNIFGHTGLVSSSVGDTHFLRTVMLEVDTLQSSSRPCTEEDYELIRAQNRKSSTVHMIISLILGRRVGGSRLTPTIVRGGKQGLSS